MSLIATLIIPRLNPFSYQSITAICVCAGAILITRGVRLFPERIRGFVVALLPPFLVYIGFDSTRYLRGHMDEYATRIIFTAFAFGLSVHCLRFRQWYTRVAGIALSSWTGAILVQMGYTYLFYRKTYPWEPLVLVISFVIVWAPLAVWLAIYHRRRQLDAIGCCVRCNYDLRGSPQSRKCPECGCVFKRTSMPS